jgi:hypothetical protein
LRDIDAECATFEILTIEIRDRLLGAFLRCHLDEAEATRLTGHPVQHQGNLADLAAARKELGDEVFGRVIGKVANVQTVRHSDCSLWRLEKRQTPTSRSEGEVAIALNETSALGVARGP